MARLEVDHPRVCDHLGVDVPVGCDAVAYELETRLEVGFRPARQQAVETSDAGRERNDAVLALDPVLAAPIAELADEVIGDLVRPASPVVAVAIRGVPRRGELRHGEAVEIHQASRVVDDQRDGNARARVDHLDRRVLQRALAGGLGRRGGGGECHGDTGGRAAQKLTASRGTHERYLEGPASRAQRGVEAFVSDRKRRHGAG